MGNSLFIVLVNFALKFVVHFWYHFDQVVYFLFFTPCKHFDFLLKIFPIRDVHNKGFIELYQNLLSLSQTIIICNYYGTVFDLDVLQLFSEVLFVNVCTDLKSGTLADVFPQFVEQTLFG